MTSGIIRYFSYHKVITLNREIGWESISPNQKYWLAMVILKEHLAANFMSHKTNSRNIFKILFTAILVSVVIRGTQPSRLLNIEGRKKEK